MTPRLLRIVLFTSIALNAGLLFYHGGRLLTHAHPPSHEDVINDRLHSFAALLPDQARAELKQKLEAQKPAIRARMNRMKALRGDIRRLLDNEPVDEPALSAAFADMRRENTALQEIYHDAFVEVTKKLDAAQRRHVTQTLHDRHENTADSATF